MFRGGTSRWILLVVELGCGGFDILPGENVAGDETGQDVVGSEHAHGSDDE